MIIEIFQPLTEKSLLRPLFVSKVAAGFPSPAEDYIEGELDLNEYFIKNPQATFYVKVSGDSMSDVGILPGDILIVDRALQPQNNKIVIAIVGSELVVKRLKIFDDRIELHAENPLYEPLVIADPDLIKIWGVVCGSARKF